MIRARSRQDRPRASVRRLSYCRVAPAVSRRESSLSRARGSHLHRTNCPDPADPYRSNALVEGGSAASPARTGLCTLRRPSTGPVPERDERMSRSDLEIQGLDVCAYSFPTDGLRRLASQGVRLGRTRDPESEGEDLCRAAIGDAPVLMTDANGALTLWRGIRRRSLTGRGACAKIARCGTRRRTIPCWSG